MRARFMWDLVPIADAVSRAQQTDAQPNLPALLLADLGDNVGAGRKSLAYHVVLQSDTKTLTDKDQAKFLKRFEKGLEALDGRLRK